MRRRLLIAAAIAILAGPATAQSLGFGLGLDNRALASAAVGPPFATATGSYSLRKVVAAYGGSAIRLRRASDSTQQDIGFASSDFDLGSANTFCAATSCFVAKWYDQSGAAQDFAQVTAGSQPPFVFSCLGSMACLSLTALTHQMSAPTASQATGIISFNAVLDRAVGTGICVLPQLSQNAVKTRSGVVGLTLTGVSGSIVTGSADATWHSATGVINGASSYLAVDGSTTSGSVTGATASSAPGMNGAASTTCFLAELAIWGNYALLASEAAALNSNQHAYWGF